MSSSRKPPRLTRRQKRVQMGVRVDPSTVHAVNALCALWTRNQGEVYRAGVAKLVAQLTPDERAAYETILRSQLDPPPPRKPRDPTPD